MQLANAELWELQAINSPAGYQAPGEQNQMNNIMDQYHTETTDAFRQLAAATEADRLAVANLAEVNTKLQTDLLSLQQDMKKILLKMETLGTTAPRPPRNNSNNESYCWSHGRTRNEEHTSPSCRNKKEGHKNDATLSNKQGGSTRWCN